MVKQRESVEQLPAYVQGKSIPGAVKLSSNENPFAPLPSIAQIVRDEADTIHLYPDMGAVAIREKLAERFGVRLEEVAVGAGSVEVANQLISASAGTGDEVVFAWRSFEAYPIMIQIAGATPVPVPLTVDEKHDLPAMAAAINERTRLVLVCNPNNPTGAGVTTAELDAFMALVPSDVLVVVDEAYVHFNTDPDAAEGIDFFRRYDNVAVLHTFSKAYGLAGLRIGYAIAKEQVAENLRRVSVPFAVSALAQKAAIASLDVEDELNERVGVLNSERARVFAELRSRGWNLTDSVGNFIWIRSGERTPAIDAVLREHAVVARAYGTDGIRISIGSPEMNDKFLAAFAEVEAF